MKCPVCRYEYDESITTCPQCGFFELGRTFISTADADEWMNTTIRSCREVWNKALNMQTSQSVSLNEELEKYIPYKEYQNRLRFYPHDYITRSWLIDYLTQIIVYRHTHPIENREELINEAIKHINFFLVNAEAGNDCRLRYTALAYHTVLAEVYLSEWDLVSALGCYYNHLSSPVFSKTIVDFINDRGWVLYGSDVYYVLHNCATICGLVGNSLFQNEFTDLCKRLGEIEGIVEDNSHALYFRGIKRKFPSERDEKSSNQGDGCTYEECCFANDVFVGELEYFPYSGHEIETKEFNGCYELFGVTTLKEKYYIWEQKKAVELYAKQILAMF